MAATLFRHTGNRTRVQKTFLGALSTAMLGLADVAALTGDTAAVKYMTVWTITLFLDVLSILVLVATVIRGLKLAQNKEFTAAKGNVLRRHSDQKAAYPHCSAIGMLESFVTKLGVMVATKFA